MIRIIDRDHIIAIVVDYLQSIKYYHGRDWSFKMGTLYRENMTIRVVAITAQSRCSEIETLLALKFSELVV